MTTLSILTGATGDGSGGGGGPVLPPVSGNDILQLEAYSGNSGGNLVGAGNSASVNDYATQVSAQTDGKIIVSGVSQSINAVWHPKIVRRLTNGRPDITFGTSGTIDLEISPIDDSVFEGLGVAGGTPAVNCLHVVLSNNKIIVCYPDPANIGQLKLKKLNSDGTPDVGFGVAGVAYANWSMTHIVPRRIIVDPITNDIIIGAWGAPYSGHRSTWPGAGTGQIQCKSCIARLLANGTPDITFGISGYYIANGGYGYRPVSDLAVQSDQKIVYVHEDDGSTATIVRLTSGGVLDATFGGTGTTQISRPGLYGEATSVLIQPDGKIVVGGWGGEAAPNVVNHVFIARFSSNGAPDGTFGTGGVTGVNHFASRTQRNGVAKLERLSDGSFLQNIFTANSADDTIVKYLSTGAIDLPFGGGAGISPGTLSSAQGTNAYNTDFCIHPITGNIISTGFLTNANISEYNASNVFQIFLSERSAVTGAPGTVFGPDSGVETFGFTPVADIVSLADEGGLVIIKSRTSGQNWTIFDTARGAQRVLSFNTSSAEFATTNTLMQFYERGFFLGADPLVNASGSNYIATILYQWPGVFDIAVHGGTGTSSRAVNHSLATTPELWISKAVTTNGDWYVGSTHLAPSDALLLNSNTVPTPQPAWDSTVPNTSTFTVGSILNQAAQSYISYLFASLPGVSKVGTYVGNGSSQTINCGFTTGARFVLIKRIDSAGDWFMWDTARGVASNSAIGEIVFASAATHNFIVPAGVASVNVVAVGSGRFSGGGLAWANNIPVVPGQNIEISIADNFANHTNIGSSRFDNGNLLGGYQVNASTGSWNSAGTLSGGAPNFGANILLGTLGVTYGGGNGGTAIGGNPRSGSGGGGAGGYSGDGGSGGLSSFTLLGTTTPGTPGTGGGGGGGGGGLYYDNINATWGTGGGGGGVGLFGQGSNGAGGINRTNDNGGGGGGGSSGTAGDDGRDDYSTAPTSGNSEGGVYGGGSTHNNYAQGGIGAVRIMWGGGRSFPNNAGFMNTSVGDPRLSLNTPAPEVYTSDEIDPATAGFIIKENATTNVNSTGATYLYLAIA